MIDLPEGRVKVLCVTCVSGDVTCFVANAEDLVDIFEVKLFDEIMSTRSGTQK